MIYLRIIYFFLIPKRCRCFNVYITCIYFITYIILTYILTYIVFQNFTYIFFLKLLNKNCDDLPRSSLIGVQFVKLEIFRIEILNIKTMTV